MEYRICRILRTVSTPKISMPDRTNARAPAARARTASMYCGRTKRSAASGGLPGYEERKIVFKESMQTPVEALRIKASWTGIIAYGASTITQQHRS